MNTEDQPTGTWTAEQRNLHVARRSMTTSQVAAPNQSDGASAAGYPEAGIPSSAKSLLTALPDASRPNEPLPIWLAVLRATPCEALSNGQYHAVRWNVVAGRAVYTNVGREPEHIEPLGLSLLGGHTMAVYWMPGDTAYTVEVYRQRELCA
jgi:hypothetical protein